MRLEAIEVSLRLGGRTILDAVSLDAHPGQLHALLGPNGAGKSTLLSLLAGDREPSAGTVLLNGRAVHAWKAAELARVRSMLTQEHEVSFPFTAREVVALGRRPWAGTESELTDDTVIDAALAAVELSAAAEQPVTTMSGGERARVALARVLAQDTEFVLLDEPTAALDLRHQEQTMQLARGLADHAEHSRAVVVVLHDLNLAAAYADTVTLLAGGRVAAQGAPAEVLTAERVSEVYQQPVRVIAGPGGPLIVPVR